MTIDRIRMDERVVVVAGAGGGGIGTAVCRSVASAGATVVGLDIDAGGRAIAVRALADCPGEHLVLEADVTDEESVTAAFADATATVGPPSGAVTVVGGMRLDHWARLDDDRAVDILADVIDFNLTPSLVVGRALAASARAHDLDASIVHVSSLAGLLGMPFGGAYGAAKAALINLTRTMAVEWGRHRIRVNSVAPGSIEVDRVGRPRFDGDAEAVADAISAAVPLGRRGTGDEVATAVLFLLSDLASYVNGHTLVVDGGSSVVPPYNDREDLPVFVSSNELRSRLLD